VLSAAFGVILLAIVAMNLLLEQANRTHGGPSGSPLQIGVGWSTPPILAIYLPAVRAVFVYGRGLTTVAGGGPVGREARAPLGPTIARVVARRRARPRHRQPPRQQSLHLLDHRRRRSLLPTWAAAASTPRTTTERECSVKAMQPGWLRQSVARPMLRWIDDTVPLPPTRLALPPGSDAPGLLAAGGRLTVERLEEAYRHGIFPWFSARQPVLWWSPDPRMALPVAEFKLSRSLRKTLRRFVATRGCEVRIDSAFEAVIHACATTRREGQVGTWIVPAMVNAYTAWHRAGRVHSFETWVGDRLLGGLYCVAVGRFVFGESMFSHATDASKVALAALVAFCRAHGVEWIDCQQNTAHLATFGARELPRVEFERRLSKGVAGPDIADWTYHPSHWAHLGIEVPQSDTDPK
jgi:leucyl/phenylalanyl-tRNA--protein transferase